ncbi:phospholipase D-like domain-containing protein [Nitrosococcus wardiae]|uniref:PLD phosphodiesterase domain-containing protein n=1 Tax=Nitrosococcus wardiae TaxID=1814290 RepID=A0A4P7BVS6_9GAMM|nr:phospholipase D-like domain-containing protein [Nitrosococcus wardiae]QBQ54021.1 hypothetical protein E3U44_05510 [Nitrosococcus wardiae]
MSPLFRNKFKVLKNGEIFYPRIAEVISQARRHIEIENYIFEPGQVADWILLQIRERLQQGISVKLLTDRIGSHRTPRKTFRLIEEAGGDFKWYRPLSWRTPLWFNNRNHRNLIIVDDQIGFMGGAGISDRWLTGNRHLPRWRDTMLEVRGHLVPVLKNAFEDHWWEATHHHLFSAHSKSNPYSNSSLSQDNEAIIIKSGNSGQSTQNSGFIFRRLIQNARKCIFVTNPYFLPGDPMTSEIKKASESGVMIKVVTAGKHADHPFIRWAARSHYSELIDSGVEIYEYTPTMIHAKTMMIDD